jgi:hypothetical protein
VEVKFRFKDYPPGSILLDWHLLGGICVGMLPLFIFQVPILNAIGCFLASVSLLLFSRYLGIWLAVRMYNRRNDDN